MTLHWTKEDTPHWDLTSSVCSAEHKNVAGLARQPRPKCLTELGHHLTRLAPGHGSHIGNRGGVTQDGRDLQHRQRPSGR